MQTLSAKNVLEEVGPALVHLLRAYRFAHDVQLDRWEFALSLRHLVEMGIGESDLRWLALNGYVEFADECTTFRDATRRFRPSLNISFNHATCFVLTAAGLRMVQGGGAVGVASAALSSNRATSTAPATDPHAIPFATAAHLGWQRSLV